MQLGSLKARGKQTSDEYAFVEIFTITTVAVGAFFIAKFAGKELYMTAKAEVRARLAVSLQKVPIFEDCEDAFVSLVAQKVSTSTHIKGHIFSQIGEECDRMWILHEGKISQKDCLGAIVLREAVGDMFTPAFGGLALMEEGPRRFEFQALTDVKVSVLLRSDLRACFAGFPSAEATMLTAVMNKYHLTAGEDLSKTLAEDLIATLNQHDSEMIHGAAKTILLNKKNDASDELLRRLGCANVSDSHQSANLSFNPKAK
jgi:hypothetical protein